jgi:flagellar biogenesis protein FliO
MTTKAGTLHEDVSKLMAMMMMMIMIIIIIIISHWIFLRMR